MNTIRWGIIGCGDVCEVKSGPGLQKADRSALVAVMRRDAEKAADYAHRHGVPRWYTDAQSLVNDPEVDAVYVATPPSTHLEYAAMAARAGKPVYVEKPMARNFAECQQMLTACREAGVPLFVAYYRRRLPRFLKVKELIESGAIGAVRQVHTTLLQHSRPIAGDLPWRLQPEISGGGLFLDLGSHTLDLLDHLLGPIAAATGCHGNQGGQYAAEDTVTAAWRFESGVLGSGEWCFCAGQFVDRVDISGTGGTLTFSSFGDNPVLLSNADGTQPFEIPHPAHIQQPLIQTMVNELTGAGGTCPSTGESAARTSRVMDQILGRF